MARLTKIEKKIAEIDKQIEFLQALRTALADAQEGRPAKAARKPSRKPAPPEAV